MSQLVQHFFVGALPQQTFLRWQSIKLLMQPAERNYSNWTVELSLSEEESKHGNRQVHIRNPENPESVGRRGLSYHLHDFDRLILPAFWVERALRNRQCR